MEAEARMKQLNDLSNSINILEQQFNGIMEMLNWDRKQLLDNVKNDTNKNNLTSISNETKKNNSNVVNKFNVQKHNLTTVPGGVTSAASHHIIPEPELIVSVKDRNLTKNMTFAEIIKLKRDLKRRRMKHRTSKTPPLSYTEKIRALITLQMETWTQYLESDKPLNID